MYGCENERGLYFARKGHFNGKEVTVTHRDPKTGNYWLEDYPVGKDPVEYGIWVDPDSVTFRD